MSARVPGRFALLAVTVLGGARCVDYPFECPPWDPTAPPSQVNAWCAPSGEDVPPVLEVPPVTPPFVASWSEFRHDDNDGSRGEDVAADRDQGFVALMHYDDATTSSWSMNRFTHTGEYVYSNWGVFVRCTDDRPCSPDVRAAVTVDDQGSSYIAGSFTDDATVLPVDGAHTHAGRDSRMGFVVKHGPTEQPKWARSWGGVTGTVRPDDIAAYPGGGFVIVGAYSGTQDLGGLTLTADAGLHRYVARYDADGNALWATDLGTATEHRQHVAVTGAGWIGVAGMRVDGDGIAVVSVDVFGAEGGRAGATEGSQNGEITALAASGDTRFVVGGSFQLDFVFGYDVVTSYEPNAHFLASFDFESREIPVRQGVGRITALSVRGDELLIAGEAAASVELLGAKRSLSEENPSLFMASVDPTWQVSWLRSVTANAPGRLALGNATFVGDGGTVYVGTLNPPVEFGGTRHASGGLGRDVAFAVRQSKP